MSLTKKNMLIKITKNLAQFILADPKFTSVLYNTIQNRNVLVSHLAKLNDMPIVAHIMIDPLNTFCFVIFAIDNLIYLIS